MKFFKKFIIYLILFILVGELIVRISGWKATNVYKDISDPDIKWVHTPNHEGKTGDVTFKINSKGLRDYEYPYAKPKDTFRILAIGECSTFGVGVSLEDTFVKQLEEILNKNVPFKKFSRYEVINGGVIQYDDLQKVAFLKEYGLKYNPDFIIFTHDIAYRAWIEIKKSMHIFAKIDSKIPRNSYFLRYIHRRLVERIILYLSNLPHDASERYQERGPFLLKTEKALEQLSEISKSRNIPILIVLSSDSVLVRSTREIDRFFYDQCGDLGLPILNFNRSLFKEENANIFAISQRNPRPNRYAYRRIAEEIYKHIVTNTLEDELR